MGVLHAGLHTLLGISRNFWAQANGSSSSSETKDEPKEAEAGVELLSSEFVLLLVAVLTLLTASMPAVAAAAAMDAGGMLLMAGDTLGLSRASSASV